MSALVARMSDKIVKVLPILSAEFCIHATDLTQAHPVRQYTPSAQRRLVCLWLPSGDIEPVILCAWLLVFLPSPELYRRIIDTFRQGWIFAVNHPLKRVSFVRKEPRDAPSMPEIDAQAGQPQACSRRRAGSVGAADLQR